MKQIYKYIGVLLVTGLLGLFLFFGFFYVNTLIHNENIEEQFIDYELSLRDKGISILGKNIALMGSAAHCIFYYEVGNTSLSQVDTILENNFPEFMLDKEYGYISLDPGINCDYYDGEYRGEDVYRNKSI